ncbi:MULTISPECIES: hypothetical protein [Xanthomonas translucens group]|uniref:hypothetical protein n=1 Tax=Xanthomonas translucens group TaxID=3390202 RepID=UPI001E52CD22|nr:hypothetical protein [Xanthomonas translucens]UKE68433.1 hypothetical protein K8O61_13145 [Xanthomonas translucens pv. pistacia]
MTSPLPSRQCAVLASACAAANRKRSDNSTITLNAWLQYAAFADGERMQRADGQPQRVTSTPLTLWLDSRGHAVRNDLMAGPQAVNDASCSTSQISTIGSAVNPARTYSQNAKTYLTGARYTSRFGAYNASRYSTATSNFVSSVRWRRRQPRVLRRKHPDAELSRTDQTPSHARRPDRRRCRARRRIADEERPLPMRPGQNHMAG